MTAPFRDHFPIFEHTAYLNSCSCGALSREVEGAYQDYLRSRHQKGADWETWVGKNETVRDQFARLIHARPNEIALTTSASASLNAVASALHPDGGRDKIVLTDFEFPTVGQIWLAQQARGFEVAFADTVEGELSLEQMDRLIDDRTRLVSLTHVCYRNGALSDVAAVVEMARARGALVLLDAYQALGAVPIDVKALDVDFLIGGSLKYLLASAGLGFLYVRQGLLDDLAPTVTGWFGQEDIFAMDHRRHEPAQGARRFEAGTPPVPSLYAAEAGLDLLMTVGMETVRRHVLGLTERLKTGVKQVGGVLATPDDPARHGAMIAIRSTDDHTLVERLKRHGVVTSCRDGNVRVSPHFYNSDMDIDACLEALSAERALLAG